MDPVLKGEPPDAVGTDMQLGHVEWCSCCRGQIATRSMDGAWAPEKHLGTQLVPGSVGWVANNKMQFLYWSIGMRALAS